MKKLFILVAFLFLSTSSFCSDNLGSLTPESNKDDWFLGPVNPSNDKDYFLGPQYPDNQNW